MICQNHPISTSPGVHPAIVLSPPCSRRFTPGRQSPPPDRWVMNRRAKAPLHLIYWPGELDSLERADTKRGGANERRGIFASDETKLIFLCEWLPVTIFAGRCRSHKKRRTSLEAGWARPPGQRYPQKKRIPLPGPSSVAIPSAAAPHLRKCATVLERPGPAGSRPDFPPASAPRRLAVS